MNYYLLALTIFLSQMSYANNFTQINCFDSFPANYELQIEVDKFETLPPQSEISLFKNNQNIGTKNATKTLINIGQNPTHSAYKFNFFDNQVFDFLRVNITLEKAHMIYNKPKVGFILINFNQCEFINGN